MVVIDTPVLSELMCREPNPDVLNWLDRRPTRELFTTAVTEAEVRAGIAFLPIGTRRRNLAEAAERAFNYYFARRILPFDSAAARIYAEMVAIRRSIGRKLSQADGQIAAIARSRNMAVVTRNARDFKDIDVEIVNPWLERF